MSRELTIEDKWRSIMLIVLGCIETMVVIFGNFYLKNPEVWQVFILVTLFFVSTGFIGFGIAGYLDYKKSKSNKSPEVGEGATA